MSRRTIHVEPAVHEFWERPNRHRFELGFLVGQCDLVGSNDLILAAVEVPSEEPDLDHEIEIIQGFDDLSVEWVVEIALQIDRLLPGGIDIVGLYVVALADAPAAIDRAALYLRAIAAALALPTGFTQPGDTVVPENHCIVHISSTTSAKTIRSFTNIRDAPRTTTPPAELQSPSSDARLKIKTFAASVAIDETIAFVPPSKTADDVVEIAENRLGELQQQLQPLVQRVWQAHGVATTAECIELVSPSKSAETPSSELEISRCRGVIECLAFVPSNGPRAVELAAYFLKRDFVRSVLARINLLLERFADDDGAAGDASILRDGGLLRLPKRGVIKWRSGATPSSDALQLSVLALAEDDEGMVVQNALEILSAGDELPGVDIDLGIESLRWLESDSEATEASSAPGVSVSPSTAARPSSKQTQPSKPDAASNNSSLFVILPLLLLLLAVLYAKFQ